jgi:hypothetical protein
MTCDECQNLALTGDPAAAEHLEGCRACQAEHAKAQEALTLAALPALSEEESARLGALEASSERAWRRNEGRRSAWRRVAGLAVAAAVGGLIASAALIRQSPHAPVAPRPEAVAVALADEGAYALEASDDEFDPSSYEVPWTDDSETTEGEAP